MDLHRAGIAFRACWEWKWRTIHDLSWASLHSSYEKMVSALFCAATVSVVGSGESTLFWTDNWIDGKSIQALAPALFGAVSRRWRRVLVSDALPGHAWVRHISGAFTVQVLAEFFQIWHKLCNTLSVTPLIIY